MGESTFQRIAIVCRGNAALRLTTAVRELNSEWDAKIRTIALHPRGEGRALYAREADERYDLGEPTFVDPRDGRRKSCYLDYERIAEALVAVKADAVWMGWGGALEPISFADYCQRVGITFIGARGETMRRCADKVALRGVATEAGIPLLPAAEGPIDGVDDALRAAEILGYPLVARAAANGVGASTPRVAWEPADVQAAFDAAQADGLAHGGQRRVLIERWPRAARRFDVPVIADSAGQLWALPARDVSLRLSEQTVLVESPPPWLPVQVHERMRESAMHLAKAVGLHGVGTVTFVHDEQSGQFALLEMSPRLLDGHAVVEAITDLDLIKLQLRLAAGETLHGEAPAAFGQGMGVQLAVQSCHERGVHGELLVERLELPAGPGVRGDRSMGEGDALAPDDGALLARIVTRGRDRAEALARLRRALVETRVVLRGGLSNKGLLIDVLAAPDLREPASDTSWVERLALRPPHASSPLAAVALLAGAIEAYEAEMAVERGQFFASALRGRPEVSEEVGRVVELAHAGCGYRLRVSRLSLQRYRIEVEGKRLVVDLEGAGASERWLRCAGRSYGLQITTDGLTYVVEVEGHPYRVSRDRGGIVRSPGPSIVVSVAVKEGDDVESGDRLLLLEAMKTETALHAPFAGRVRKVYVAPKVQVGTGAPLFLIEPPSDEHPVAVTEPLDLAALVEQSAAEGANPSPLAPLRELRSLLLGYDADAVDLRRRVAERGLLTADALPGDEGVRRAEDEILSIFVELGALFGRGNQDESDDETARVSSTEYLLSYLRDVGGPTEGLPSGFVGRLRSVLALYGVHELDRSPQLEESLYRIYQARQRLDQQISPVMSILQRRIDHMDELTAGDDASYRTLLDRLIVESQGRFPAINDLVHELRYRTFDRPILVRERERVLDGALEQLRYLAEHPDAADRDSRMAALISCPQSLVRMLFVEAREAPALRRTLLEVLVQRLYRIRALQRVELIETAGMWVVRAGYPHEDKTVQLFAVCCADAQLQQAGQVIDAMLRDVPANDDVLIDFFVDGQRCQQDPGEVQAQLSERLDSVGFHRPIRRVVVVSGSAEAEQLDYFTFRSSDGRMVEDQLYRGLHPMIGKRLQLWRLSNFQLERLPSTEDIHLYLARGAQNPQDERLLALAEVRDLTPLRDVSGRVIRLPHAERLMMDAITSIRRAQVQRPADKRLQWNRIQLFIWPELNLVPDEIADLVHRLAPATDGLGLERVVARAQVRDPQTGVVEDRVLDIAKRGSAGVTVRYREPPTQPLQPMSPYTQKVVALRRRGMMYPYELIELLTPAREGVQADFPPGEFEEYDLDEQQQLVPVRRPYGLNTANIVVGVIRNFTDKVPEGMARVVLLGDPSRAMGSLAEPECRRINAALDLAQRLRVPLEWFALSAGAKISMDSGVENMDWISLVLRRLIEYTQAGGEVNVIVCGVTVGAQPYWNAEATMLMHTRGILVMTAGGSMVLTGKRALDYSGGVSADDNEGIGGYDRVMGPNGQAQYWAADLTEACHILLRYYDHTYIVPGERSPRRSATTDPIDRDVCDFPHGHANGHGFATVGEVFSEKTNPGRKKPFDIRRVMAAAVDQDDRPLERWYGMRDAEVAVVWDACIGGYPVCLLGIESRPLPRLGFIPADGPRQWTAGTLFPLASKKIARAVNAASNNRPLVILANLSGFDGSPESMRNTQLEYGAEIGRAVVNFVGPIVFCVVSRYHGGAFVVFSNKLNERMEVAALEGTFASVIGGAPAAAVVFARDVNKRVRADERLKQIEEQLAAASGPEKVKLRVRLDDLKKVVYAEKLGEVAGEFDRVHDIYRAQKLGAVHHIIAPQRLRPYLVEAIQRGRA